MAPCKFLAMAHGKTFALRIGMTAERNLVCQEQGYNGSSLEDYSNSATNSSGNTTHSCEQLTQHCEEKISMEIKCSGIRTFLSPQNKS